MKTLFHIITYNLSDFVNDQIMLMRPALYAQPHLLLLPLLFLLVVLQFRLWVGEGSMAQMWQVHEQIREQEQGNSLMQARNDALAAEVVALQRGPDKFGLDVIEGLARKELGMIRKGETFFFISD